ncbi:MAG TPA: glycosyltransferase, partial [Thermoanaerobaculia bacterium]|nr:glycosyltransferase [Thermoanaerobaculia bacterium]
MGRVSVVLITWNSARWLPRCLEGIRGQTVCDLELLVVDNGSADGSAELAGRLDSEAVLILNGENRGFAAAANQGIRATSGDFVLLVNPDAFLDARYLEVLLDRFASLGADFGAGTGKLLRGEGDGILPTDTLDSYGIRMTRSGRHLDLGSGERDHDIAPIEVFGVSGAAALYRRSMLEDVMLDGEIFDEDFFAYREDADLAWRARLRGWRAFCDPGALGWHVRRVTPRVRRELPPELNFHSVKNRFLLRARNQGRWLSLRNAPATLLRDLVVLGATLTVERSSFPAWAWLWNNRARIRRKRDLVQSGRRVGDREISTWFSRPVRPRARGGAVSSLRIGIVGTRGIPARYGGFETFAGELGRRLVQRGHRVTVYCRRHLYGDVGSIWEGVERIELPSIRQKYLETVSHTALSAVDALHRDFDVALLCNAANAFVLPLLRAARIPVAVNVDGIEQERRKWNLLGRLIYQIGQRWSVAFGSRVVADAEVIAEYYRHRFAAEPLVIPYGSEIEGEGEESDVLCRFDLEPGKYLLYVSRLEPENNPLEVIEAYHRVETSMPLIMVGDAPYSSELIAAIRNAADDRVVLPGALYGAPYRDLQRHAFLYIQATEVGGT